MKKLEIAKQLINLLDGESDNRWVIDGGCHHGLVSRAMAELFPDTNILAFEPGQEAFNTATNNTSAFRNRITLVNAALGEQSGQAEFFTGSMSATNSLLPRPTSELKAYYPPEASLQGGNMVDVVTLDEECSQHNINEIDLLKLDLQGGELSALKGGKGLLESGKVKVILSEAVFIRKYKDQPLLWQLWQYLEDFDYSVFTLEDIKIGLYNDSEDSLRQQQWNQSDIIFISKEVRQALDR